MENVKNVKTGVMMKNRRLNKILTIVICILFLFTAVTNSVFAANTCYSEHCMFPNCPVCMMIENAVNFINILGIVFIYIVILGGIIPLTHLIENTISRLRRFSLIEYQVQHNE